MAVVVAMTCDRTCDETETAGLVPGVSANFAASRGKETTGLEEAAVP